ncbi:MAG: iron-sulfur cluster assembly scaffold protein [Desulfobacteraceae bacterium]|nr:MAG: iron-sulfur cluster assembly scaffold protein [Desulfobacteraceae bacterium]
MASKNFDFWQDHSAHYLEMALGWDRRERIRNPDGYGKRTGECGDTIEMFLIIRDGRIQYASFEADGCMNTSACANTVIHFAEGKTIEEAWDISTEMVVGYLETLPPDEVHCAELAVGAFYLALSDTEKKKDDDGGGMPEHCEPANASKSLSG